MQHPDGANCSQSLCWVLHSTTRAVDANIVENAEPVAAVVAITAAVMIAAVTVVAVSISIGNVVIYMLELHFEITMQQYAIHILR
jgi:hypothetical protein